jgi:hypothetical protein
MAMLKDQGKRNSSVNCYLTFMVLVFFVEKNMVQKALMTHALALATHGLSSLLHSTPAHSPDLAIIGHRDSQVRSARVRISPRVPFEVVEALATRFTEEDGEFVLLPVPVAGKVGGRSWCGGAARASCVDGHPLCFKSRSGGRGAGTDWRGFGRASGDGGPDLDNA